MFKRYFNKEFIENEIVLIVAVVLALISSFFSMPKIKYIDFKVLMILFSLMIVIQGFSEIKILDAVATGILKKCSSYKQISAVLVFVTFLVAMIVTNDVALITFVPLTLIIGKKANINILRVVVIQTLAANLGSVLTPIGNPQNLFLYSFYNIKPKEFFTITAPIALISVVFLIILLLIEKNDELEVNFDDVNIKSKKQGMIFSALLCLILSSVFYLIDYKLSFCITVIAVLMINKRLFFKVDYSLLITFIGFFIFIGNISNMDIIKNFMSGVLNSESNTYWTSIVCSQFISNVPATMLLSGFTNHYAELLRGVNIGGMGTLIASLASVISYKLYVKENRELGKRYLSVFTIYNVVGLVLFSLMFFFVVV